MEPGTSPELLTEEVCGFSLCRQTKLRPKDWRLWLSRACRRHIQLLILYSVAKHGAGLQLHCC